MLNLLNLLKILKDFKMLKFTNSNGETRKMFFRAVGNFFAPGKKSRLCL